MIEERRFFLRISLWTGPIAAVYWLITQERVGTILLLSVTAACLFLMVTLGGGRGKDGGRGEDGGRGQGGSRTSKRPTLPKGPVAKANAIVGFGEPEGTDLTPIELEEEPVPSLSPWPLSLSGGATLVVLGLIYGPWLWTPGALITAWAAWGWLRQLDG